MWSAAQRSHPGPSARARWCGPRWRDTIGGPPALCAGKPIASVAPFPNTHHPEAENVQQIRRMCQTACLILRQLASESG